VSDRPWWADFTHEFVAEFGPGSEDPKWACLDCGINTYGEYYVVHPSVWPIAVNGGKLCVTCLEQRIGRPLTPADFLPCPANDLAWRKSTRLLTRMRDD